MIYKKCLNCGKRFGIKKPSEAKRPNRNCCSRSCASTLKNNNRYKDIGCWKICEGCGKEFFAKYASERKKKYCTMNCAVVNLNKARKWTKEQRDKSAQQAIKNFKGKKRSRDSVHKSAKGISGEKHWNWQGGRSGWNSLMRANIEYKEWRRAVFERDNFTCQICGATGGVRFNADHIKPLCAFPKLAYDIDNGRTLCVPCHKNTKTFAARASAYKNLRGEIQI